MSNVLSEEKKQQVIALGKLGWPLRRIEQATGVRRETAGAYLKAAGIGVRAPGGWGRRAPAKPANEVTTDSSESKPANEVTTDFGPPISLPTGNPGSGQPVPASRTANCIELGLGRGRNAMAIWQDLVSDHGFPQRLPDREAFCAQASRFYTTRSRGDHSHRSGRRSTGRLRHRARWCAIRRAENIAARACSC